MGTENYRIGLSKVLFKAGILSSLEEPRDAVTEKLLQLLKKIKAMLEQKKSLQKNLKAYLLLRIWKWAQLWNNIQPLLQGSKKEEEAEEARLAAQAKLEADRLAKEAVDKLVAKRMEEARQKEVEMQRVRDEAANATRA
jgi:myosin protein heavy chain